MSTELTVSDLYVGLEIRSKLTGELAVIVDTRACGELVAQLTSGPNVGDKLYRTPERIVSYWERDTSHDFLL